MSRVADDDALPLQELDKHLSAVRRVLARTGEGPVRPPYFADNLRRLLRPVHGLVLPEPIAAWVTELDEAIVTDALGEAWQILGRVDRTLGLPLPTAKRRRRRVGPRSLLVQRVQRPARKSDKADQAAKADVVEAAEAVSVGDATGEETQDAPAVPVPTKPSPSLSWGSAIEDLDLDAADHGRLRALGLSHVSDVLAHRPARSHVITPVHGAGRAVPEGEVALGGRVRARIEIVCRDGSRVCQLALQGAERAVVTLRAPLGDDAASAFRIGSKVVLAARNTAGEGDPASLVDGRRVHVEHGKAYEVTQFEDPADDALFRRALSEALPVVSRLAEPLPRASQRQAGVESLPTVLQQLRHKGDLDAAVSRRLAFEELFAVSLGVMAPRFGGASDRGIAHALVHQQVAQLSSRGLLGDLGDDAQRALDDVKRDLISSAPMRRLVCGDAASPVDALGLRACLMVAESRSQVLVVSSDPMAAAVRYDQWRDVLRAYGHRTSLLRGEPRRADRDAIRRGEVQVVFGAPDVFAHKLEWRRLGLVIADEQRVHGLAAEHVLKIRSARPDLMVVCRTPVFPARLLDAYGAFDVSRMDSGQDVAPAQRWSASDRQAAYAAVGEAVAADVSAIVAFPLTRSSGDLLSLGEATALAKTLSEEVFGGRAVAVYHGAMTLEQRNSTLRDFEERRVRVLMATTTVELVAPMPRGVVGLMEHSDRVDVQRLLAFRALLTPTGRLHLVEGQEPNGSGVAVIQDLVAQARDQAIVQAHPDASEAASDVAAPPAWDWCWGRPDDADLLLAAREVAADIYRSSGTRRNSVWAGALRHATITWGQLTDADSPIPRSRTGAGRRRKRRRKRR